MNIIGAFYIDGSCSCPFLFCVCLQYISCENWYLYLSICSPDYIFTLKDDLAFLHSNVPRPLYSGDMHLFLWNDVIRWTWKFLRPGRVTHLKWSSCYHIYLNQSEWMKREVHLKTSTQNSGRGSLSWFIERGIQFFAHTICSNCTTHKPLKKI